MSKKDFADQINTLGNNGNKYLSDCEKYGMTWGCDEDCPVLEKGNCGHWSSVEEYLKSDHVNVNKYK